MTITSGVFRSVGGDRKYTAEFFRSYFSSFIGNGVFPNPSTNLQAFPGQGLTTQIRPGKAWINGAYMINDDNFVINHEPPNPSLSRIDRIIVGLNTETREMTIYNKTGTPSANPQPQPVLRTQSVYELALADITIVPTTLSIQSNNIRDLRMNTDVCGFVTGLIQQVDTTTLFNQYQEALLNFETVQQADFLQWSADRRQEFEDWYATVQDTLEGDVANNLLNLIMDNTNLIEMTKEIIPTKFSNLGIRDPKYVAHRGLSGIAPENTIPAYIMAGKVGSWGAECDILPTSDGHWILMHDDTVDRTTNGTGLVKNMTLAQIKNLRIIGGNNVSLYPNLRVPTLLEYLEVCRYYGMVPVIEIKGDNTSANYQTLVDVIKRYGYEENCVVISFSLTALQEVRSRSNKIAMQFLAPFNQNSINAAIQLGNCGINVQFGQITEANINLAHSQGITVNCYTVDDRNTANRFIKFGIDYITTNILV